MPSTTLKKQLIKAFVVVFLPLSFACPAHASTPKSIKYIEELFVDDSTVYTHYIVSCKNGGEFDISSWDNNKLWCEGKGKKDVCNKKKIKTAKQVCS